MKLVEAEIKNFKSFGENDNNLFIDKLNVVIGKNESGKSNLIDALAGINSVGYTSYEYFNKKNRNTNLDIQLKLTFENYVSENKSKEKTYLTIESYENYTISGWLSKYIKENKDFNELYKSIMDLNEEGLSFNRYENQRNLNEIIDMLSTADEKIFIRPEYFKNYINTLKSSNNEKHKELSELLQKIASILESFYSFFPAFIKVDNNELRSKYNIQNIEDDEVLKKFLEICDIKLDELKQIMTTDDTTEMRNYERDYNLKIKSNFTDSFTKFYSQENISIQIAINFKEISIIIDKRKRDVDMEKEMVNLTIDNQNKEQAAVYNRSGGYYFDENIIVTDKDTLYSTHVEFEISYDITTSEKITELSAASIDLILIVTLKDKKVLTFDLGNYLPSSGNITVDNETQSNACNITETDQVDIRYNLSETGTLSDENGVYQYTYRFDIRVGCRVGSGTNFVVISQK